MHAIIRKFVNVEVILYIIFGVLTTLVDWGMYAWLWSYKIDYRLSTALSWLAAVSFAFITNKLFVFRSYDVNWHHLWKEFISFFSCRGATGVITLLSMMLMVGVWHWHEFIGKLISSVASLILNYILSKLLIFRKPKSSGRSL